MVEDGLGIWTQGEHWHVTEVLQRNLHLWNEKNVSAKDVGFKA